MATILLVEDDPGVQHLLKDVLVASGYTVLATDTLQAARETLRDIKADLVITDGVLSDGRAVEWAEELYAQNQLVLLVSGSESSHIVPTLGKPVSIAVLRAKVRQLLEKDDTT